MNIREIDEGLSVSPQIRLADMPAIKQAGFRAILCNRPDGEAADQPAFEHIEAAAKAEGLTAAYLPIISGAMKEDDGPAFGKALMALPGPVLAYCRSGTRSTIAWALSQAGQVPAAEIVHKAEKAGYDISAVLHDAVKSQGTPR